MKKMILKTVALIFFVTCLFALVVKTYAEEDDHQDTVSYKEGDNFEFDINPDTVTKIEISKYWYTETITDRATIEKMCNLLNEMDGVLGESSKYHAGPLVRTGIFIGDDSTPKYLILTWGTLGYTIGEGNFDNFVQPDDKEAYEEFDEMTWSLYNDSVLKKFKCGLTYGEIDSLTKMFPKVSDNDDTCVIFELQHVNDNKEYHLHVWFDSVMTDLSNEQAKSIKYELYQGTELINSGEPSTESPTNDAQDDVKGGGCGSSISIGFIGLASALSAGYVFLKKKK